MFDVIVVGSGITGGLAAKELTEHGLKVLMVERGRSIEHGSGYVNETKAPWEMPFRGVGDQNLWNRDYAVQKGNRAFDEWTQDHFVNDREHPYSVSDGTSFDWWRSYQLGGRSLVWGRQCYRWSDHDFGANKADGHGTDWPIRYADLKPWYDHVEEFIGVSGSMDNVDTLPDGKFQPPMALNVVEQHLKSIIEAKYADRKLVIGRAANLTEAKDARAPCQYRGICARGCSYGAYFSTQSSTLPAAQATGRLTLLTDTLVEQVMHDPATKRVTGIAVLDTNTGARSTHTAKVVFLNAGSFNSVHLMLRSHSAAFPNGLANSSGVLGTHIMDHPTTLSMVAEIPGFEGHTSYGNRPTGIFIPRFRNLGEAKLDFVRGYTYQGGALQSTWTRGKREAGIGADAKARLRKTGPWRFVTVSYAESLPRPENRLTLDSKTDANGAPLLKISFSHGDNERRALADSALQMQAMMKECGGKIIISMNEPGHGGTAIHEMGGARMGIDPVTSVLNGFNQAHDIANLFVTDGAAMVSSATQNPSLTYMALTARACGHAAELLKAGTI